MNEDGLSAIKLRRKVARYLHAGLRLLNRRLVPLTHLALLFQAQASYPGETGTFTKPVSRAKALHFYMFSCHDNFKSYFLM